MRNNPDDLRKIFIPRGNSQYTSLTSFLNYVAQKILPVDAQVDALQIKSTLMGSEIEWNTIYYFNSIYSSIDDML